LVERGEARRPARDFPKGDKKGSTPRMPSWGLRAWELLYRMRSWSLLEVDGVGVHAALLDMEALCTTTDESPRRHLEASSGRMLMLAEELVARSERERDQAQLQRMDLGEEVEIRHEKGKEKLLARTFSPRRCLGESRVVALTTRASLCPTAALPWPHTAFPCRSWHASPARRGEGGRRDDGS